MDDSQCRVCLAEIYASFSVFKNVNGVAIKEMLDFVAELKVFVICLHSECKI